MDQLPQYEPRRRTRDKAKGEGGDGRASKHAKSSEQKAPQVVKVIPLEAPVAVSSDNLTKLISPSLTQACVAQVENALEAMHNRGDYTYESVSAIFRAATLALLNGELESAQEPLGGSKKRQPILLTEEDYERYEDRFQNNRKHRGVVIERATLTFLAQGLVATQV